MQAEVPPAFGRREESEYFALRGSDPCESTTTVTQSTWFPTCNMSQNGTPPFWMVFNGGKRKLKKQLGVPVLRFSDPEIPAARPRYRVAWWEDIPGISSQARQNSTWWTPFWLIFEGPQKEARPILGDKFLFQATQMWRSNGAATENSGNRRNWHFTRRPLGEV